MQLQIVPNHWSLDTDPNIRPHVDNEIHPTRCITVIWSPGGASVSTFNKALRFLYYQWRRYTRACQGKCPGKKTSALVVALPEIWDHQFSSFRSNTLAKYINSQYESRLSKSKMPFHSDKNPFTLTAQHCLLNGTLHHLYIYALQAVGGDCYHTFTV